jgi:hypothetical protein
MIEMKMTQHQALFQLPYVRGLMYLHVIAARNGLICRRQSSQEHLCDTVFANHSQIAASIPDPEEEYGY